MKYSYTDSLITLAAALEQACSIHINKYDNPVANLTTKDSTIVEYNSDNHKIHNRIGIKFDNVSAGKYFALIHTIQRTTGMNRAIEKSDELIQQGTHVTRGNK